MTLAWSYLTDPSLVPSTATSKAGVLEAWPRARSAKDPLYFSGYGLTYRVQENSPLPNISYRSA